jgi:hypothetical protein
VYCENTHRLDIIDKKTIEKSFISILKWSEKFVFIEWILNFIVTSHDTLYLSLTQKSFHSEFKTYFYLFNSSTVDVTMCDSVSTLRYWLCGEREREIVIVKDWDWRVVEFVYVCVVRNQNITCIVNTAGGTKPLIPRRSLSSGGHAVP